MLPPDAAALLAYLRENLELRVETTSEYTGGDPLYAQQKTLQLVLDGTVISEVSL